MECGRIYEDAPLLWEIQFQKDERGHCHTGGRKFDLQCICMIFEIYSCF